MSQARAGRGDVVRQRWARVRRDLGYLLWLVPSVWLSWLLLFAVVWAAMSTIVAGLGLVLLPVVLVVVRRWTDLHRRFAGRVLGVSIPARYRRLRGGIGDRLRQVGTDRTTWRDLAWLLVNVPVGMVFGLFGLMFAGTPFVTVFSMFFWWLRPADSPLHLLVGIPLTDWGTAIGLGLLQLVVLVPLAFLVVPALAGVHASLTHALLGRSVAEQLEERVDELTETRAGAVDAHGAELRRIERDLHDGTQARLVAISVRAGIARQALADDPDTTDRLLRDVQDGAEEAMGELRTILRTMYPPILTDRGLPGALHSLAAQSAVPTRVDLDDLGTLPAAVEAAAYFTVSEALTNVAKHSVASVANVSVSRTGGRLFVTVTDDGRGGVDETHGTGIAGIRRRIAALDGSVRIDSPPGGPTSITVELPCGSS